MDAYPRPSGPVSAGRLSFRLLGPMDVSSAGAPVRLAGRRQRVVLAGLLLRANDVASTGYLTRAAWEAPPRAPESNLRTYIAGLRRMLRDAGEDGARLTTQPHGYSLLVRSGELDIAIFEELAGRGQRALAGGEFAAAADCFRAALGLWRGQPLEGEVLGPVLRAEVERLQERRFAAVERYCEACAAIGRFAELAAELRWLASEQPLREELCAQLMLALDRSGRQAEALDVFRETRARLVGDLGVEPGPRMRQAPQQILSGIAPHSARVCQPPTAVAGSDGCHRLPADLADFTGRHEELRHLLDTIEDEATDTGAAVLCVIEGMAGVGKTRLAVHAANRLTSAGRFDEIQLWADLRGFDAEQEPADPTAVLEDFLRALGVPGERIPLGLEQRAGLYRDLLSSRRALVLLDNAAGEDQLRPLLPGGPSCLVLVTTRRSFADLDGARTVPLDVFSEVEALDLLGRVAGTGRVGAEPPAAAQIVRLCGYLPLAIALAARRLRGRRTWHLADLADRLQTDDHRLNQFGAGTRGVRTVFELSYRALSLEHRRLYRLLGLHPGDTFTAHSAGATADIPVDRAELVLDVLLDSHLVDEVAPGRYRLHDLLRAYARERVQNEETPVERDAAIERLLVWYLHTAGSADRILQPHRRHPLDPREAPCQRLCFGSRAQAMGWMETEHASLVRAVGTAVDHGRHRIAWQLPLTLLTWFYLRKYWDDWIRTFRTALSSARLIGDLPGQAAALNGLGVAHSDLSQYSEAITCHEQALVIDHMTGDLAGQAWNLNNLGVAYCDLHRFGEAANCFHQALELHRKTDGRHGEGIVLSNLADTYRELGDLDTAMAYAEQALRIQRASGDDATERYALCCVGDITYARKEYRLAVPYYRRSLTASRKAGDRWQVAIVLTKLAGALRASEAAEAANLCLEEALAVLAEFGGRIKADQMRVRIRKMAADWNMAKPV